MTVPWRRIFKWSAAILGSFVIVLALAIGALRIALAQVPEYRENIRGWINRATGLEVKFNELKPRWRLYGPEIYFTEAKLEAPLTGAVLVEARAGSVGIDLWHLIFRAELLPGRITLERPELNFIRTPSGRIELVGQEAIHRRDPSKPPMTGDDLPTGKLNIEDATVTYVDQMQARPKWRLSDISLEIERDRDELTIKGRIDLPENLGRALDFSVYADGHLGQLDALAWQFEAVASDLKFAGWVPLVRDAFGDSLRLPSAGRGGLRLAGRFAGRDLEEAQLRLQLADVALGDGSAEWPQTRYDVMAGDFLVRETQGAWHVEGKDVELGRPARPWNTPRFSADWRIVDHHIAAFTAQAAYLRLDNLTPLAGLLPPGPLRTRLTELSPEGQIRDLSVEFANADGQTPELRSLDADLTGVGFGPTGRAPGIRGVSAKLSGRANHLSADLDATQLSVLAPVVFRVPIVADRVKARLEADYRTTGVRIEAHNVAVSSPHAQATAELSLWMPADGSSPVLDLEAHAKNADASKAWQYMPINKLKDKPLAWLDQAFVAGRVPEAEVVYRGPTRSFPFRDGEGLFRITGRTEDLTLSYQPGWPVLTGLAVDFEFLNEGLTTSTSRGRLSGLVIEKGTAVFPDLKLGELTVEAQAHGDLAAALKYLQATPLGPKFGDTFMQLAGSGATRASVKLFLPIRDLSDRRIDVEATLADDRIRIADTLHQADEINGVLKVHNTELLAQGLTGRYLGGPVRIDLATEPMGTPAVFDTVLRASGRTQAAPLAAAFEMPEKIHVDGTFDWRATMRIARNIEEMPRPSRLRFDSPLRGVEIGLPQPIQRTAGESRGLHVDAQWSDAEVTARIVYGDTTRAAVKFEHADGGWEFDRGAARFGGGEPQLPKEPGLWVAGTVPALDLSEWLELKSDKPAKRQLHEYLKSVDLVVRDFGIFGYKFANIDATLATGEDAWRVHVVSDAAQGNLVVPFDLEGDLPLELDMDRLTLGEHQGGGKSNPDPAHFPSMRIAADSFSALGKRFGTLQAQLLRDDAGLRLKSFTTSSHSFTSKGSGSWLNTPNGQQSTLEFTLDTADVLETLKDLGYGASLSGKKGMARANLAWTGAPDSELFARLTGTAHMEVANGQLLTVQPGAGRVLGLMSVGALSRRLSLDFSDLTDKGLAFDSIRGDFRLKDGNAFTSNLLLKGPAAEIGVVGRTGLDAHDYDQTAVVTGSVGQSLPAVGTLAGGPAVGAALLVFSQLFKEPLKGIARGYYRITGNWDNPNVQRLEGADVKEARAATEQVREEAKAPTPPPATAPH
ncbi:MAG TPA: YhdP family protein [Steroidobacteraceae bacterium]|nr:YhdP family protein [Steroidobacteraceae bacterium]